MNVILYTDGGARGNPGPAGIGGVIFDNQGEVLAEVSEYIGETTNNVAEYQALLQTLLKAKELGATVVDCFLDSQLHQTGFTITWLSPARTTVTAAFHLSRGL